MKVKIITPTAWNGGRLKPGDETMVEDATGKRWIKNRIAEEIHSAAVQKAVKAKE